MLFYARHLLQHMKSKFSAEAFLLNLQPKVQSNQKLCVQEIGKLSQLCLCSTSQKYRHHFESHSIRLLKLIFDSLSARDPSSFISHELRSLTKLALSIDTHLSIIHHIISRKDRPWHGTAVCTTLFQKEDVSRLKNKILSFIDGTNDTATWFIICIMYSNDKLKIDEINTIVPKILQSLTLHAKIKSNLTLALSDLLYKIIKDSKADLKLYSLPISIYNLI